ncbi:MAG: chaperone NapD [Pseudomonadota bacterium]
MNISGVLVHTIPEQADEVKTRLMEIPGVEVHAVTENGRLIVTIEDDDEKVVADKALDLHQCQGVISAAMIYQYGNNDEDFEEEISI